jgi:formate hydrogenlyase subunit 3/multisubunit Na+/H+ antiporter MnhD subunit
MMCALACGLLALVPARWSKMLSIIVGLFAIAYGWYYEFGIAAEGLQFSLFKATISFLWTGIARVMWPTVLIPMTLIYLSLFEKKDSVPQFIALTLLSSLGIFLVLTSRTFVSMFLGWELMLWPTYFMVRMEAKNRAIVRPNLNWSIVTTVALVVSVLLLSFSGWNSSFGAVSDKLTKFDVYSVVGLLILFLVFIANMGIFPFHRHTELTLQAVDPMVSSYLSGVMTKAGLFGTMFISLLTGSEWLSHFGTVFSVPIISIVLDVVVIVGAIFLTWKASRTETSLDILPYISSVQLSYIVIILPFMPMEVDYLPAAFMASAMLGYAHSLAQTGLYLSTGWALAEDGTQANGEPKAEGALHYSMPFTTFASIISGLSVVALPPLIGFGAVYMVYTGFLEMNMSVLSGLILPVSVCLLLCTGYYFQSFFQSVGVGKISEAGLFSKIVSVLLGVSIIGLGVFNTSLQRLLLTPLKDLSGFFVMDFNTLTASGSWNSLYILAILSAAILMATLAWSFATPDKPLTQEDQTSPNMTSDNLQKEENKSEEGENR